MSSDFCIKCDNALAVYCGKCVDVEREELNRLRRLVPTGSYTLNVAHEEEIQRLRSQLENVLDNHAQGGWQARTLDAERERDAAQAKADQYERDWYKAKSEFGSAMAKMREALRAAEKRELGALAELDEERANVEMLKTHVETLREAWRSASDEVAREKAKKGEPVPAGFGGSSRRD